MITETWKYDNTLFRDVEYDKFYCDKLNRIVDLGWDEVVSMVHHWVTKFNVVNLQLHKIGIKTDLIQMNQFTFDLLEVRYNEWYEFYENDKLGLFNIKISENIENNIVQLLSNEIIVGKVIIQK